MVAAKLFLVLLITSVIVNAKRLRGTPIPIGGVTVIPIEHASVVLTSNVGGNIQTIYADPISTLDRYDGLARPDILLLTHPHGDHFISSLVLSLVSANTIVVAPADVSATLRTAGYQGEIAILSNNVTTAVKEVRITAVPAYNTTPGRTAHPRGSWNGYLLEFAGETVYISGDTEDVPEMRALQGVTIAFICMNLPYTMDVYQASSAVVQFAPQHVLAYHFGYPGQAGRQNVTLFQELIESQTNAVRVIQGEWYAE